MIVVVVVIVAVPLPAVMPSRSVAAHGLAVAGNIAAAATAERPDGVVVLVLDGFLLSAVAAEAVLSPLIRQRVVLRTNVRSSPQV